jgi:serine/threonine-protein kinase
MPEYQAARDSYQRATELDPHYVAACSNQADIHLTIGEYQIAVGDDPQPALDAARRIATHCLTIDDRYYLALENLAQAEIALARYFVEHEQPPRDRIDALLRAARDALARDERAHPGYGPNHYYRLTAEVVDATDQLNRGSDPTSSLAAGRAALARALRPSPLSPLVHIEAARLALAEAGWATRTHRDAAEARARARVAAEQATALDPQRAGAWLVAAEAYLAIATAEPRPDAIQLGRDRAESALHLNRRLVAAETVRAALVRLRRP